MLDHPDTSPDETVRRQSGEEGDQVAIGYSCEFERKHPFLFNFLFDLAFQLVALPVAWVLGSAYMHFIDPIIEHLFPDSKLARPLLVLGLLFLATVVAPIVIAVIDWRKFQNRTPCYNTESP